MKAAAAAVSEVSPEGNAAVKRVQVLQSVASGKVGRSRCGWAAGRAVRAGSEVGGGQVDAVMTSERLVEASEPELEQGAARLPPPLTP